MYIKNYFKCCVQYRIQSNELRSTIIVRGRDSQGRKRTSEQTLSAVADDVFFNFALFDHLIDWCNGSQFKSVELPASVAYFVQSMPRVRGVQQIWIVNHYTSESHGRIRRNSNKTSSATADKVCSLVLYSWSISYNRLLRGSSLNWSFPCLQAMVLFQASSICSERPEACTTYALLYWHREVSPASVWHTSATTIYHGTWSWMWNILW